MTDVEDLIAAVREGAHPGGLATHLEYKLADALESLNKENQALKQSLKARIESLETRMGDIADRIGS